MRRFNWFLVIIIAALVVLRIPALLHPVLDVDEAIYGLFSRIWFDGGIPYFDCVEKNPIGIYFIYGLIFSIFGKWNMIAVHAVTIAIVGLTAYVIYLIANICHSRGSKRESREYSRTHEIPAFAGMTNASGDDSAGLWAALFYVVFTTTYIPKVIATTVEPVMLLPICLQFYWWLKFEESGHGRFAFLSGLAFAAACCFKYQAGINLFVLLLYIVIPAWGSCHSRESGNPVNARYPRVRGDDSVLLGLGRFFVGALIPPAIMLVYLYFMGALADFWFWNIGGNLQYIGEGSSTLKIGRQILTRALPFVASTGLVWVLAVVAILRSSSLQAAPSEQSAQAKACYSKERWLILLWLLLTIIPVSTGYRFYGHYFLLLMPPLAILAAPVAARIWGRSGDRHVALRAPRDDKNNKLLKGLVAFWMILPALGFFAARFYISDIHQAIGEDNLENYKPLAAYVAEHTNPGDRIIAWGYAPLIYWDAKRLPATRFFWSDLLTGRVSGTKGEKSSAVPDKEDTIFWDMFMNDIERHKPAYIIDTTPANLHDYKAFPVTRYPRLMEFINGNYREESVISDVVFYKRNEMTNDKIQMPNK